MLFVVEDLHWVDPTTVELLTLLVEQIHDARILALFTCRPEFRSPWTGDPNVTEMNLTRLPAGEAAELIEQVAGGKALPDEIVADVVAKTDGVPLFIEELTKTLLESGLLEEEPGPLRTGRATTAACDTQHPARLADGPPGPPVGDQRVGATRRGDRPRVLLRPAASRFAVE